MNIHSGSVSLFITGAGISRSAGIPTYYGDGGLYNNAEERFGSPISDVITPEFFQRNPKFLWDEIFSKSYEYSTKASPTTAHKKILEIQERTKDSLVITQNIDGLHGESENVCEIHGTIHHSRCEACGKQYETSKVIDSGEYKCGSCNMPYGYIRPNAILFGEMYQDSELQKIFGFFNRNEAINHVFFVGSQMQFPFFEDIMRRAQFMGANVYIINPDPKVQFDGGINFTKTSDDFFSELEISD